MINSIVLNNLNKPKQILLNWMELSHKEMQNLSNISSDRESDENLKEIQDHSQAEVIFGFEVSTNSIMDLFQDVAISL